MNDRIKPKSLINESWLVDQPTAVEFQSRVIPVWSPTKAINFQFYWEENVVGTIVFQASIFDYPYKWEDYINDCRATFKTTSFVDRHCIYSLRNVWMDVAYLRFIWKPETSFGNISAAIRIVSS